MCGSMADIQSATAEIRRGKKEGGGKKPQGKKYNRATITRSFGLHFCGRKLCISSTTFTQCTPKATEVDEITQNNAIRPLRRSRSFKVTDFGTDRKLIGDFLLVINTILSHVLHRFQYIAFDRSKIAIFGYRTPMVVTPPTKGFPWDDRCKILWMSTDGQ